MGTPAVIFKNKFIYNWYVGAGDFTDYINRPQAFKNDYKDKSGKDLEYDFFEYMRNSDKSDGAFDDTHNLLSIADLNKYRTFEKESRDEGCPKYIGVISFNNQFLIDNGLMIKGHLDLNSLKDTARKGINALINTSDKLHNENCYWSAAIHTSTDNVHIHYSLCEYHRTENRNETYKYKGKDSLELKAFNKLKSVVANDIISEKRTPQLTAFKRENLIPNFASTITASKELLELINKLPPKPPHSDWQYNNAKVRPHQADINRCIDKIIDSNETLRRDFSTYVSSLLIANEQYKSFYGDHSDYMAYSENQLSDFYNRAGNQLLHKLSKMKYQLDNKFVKESDFENTVAQAVSKKEEKKDYEEYLKCARQHEYFKAANALNKTNNPTFEYTLAKLYTENFVGQYQQQGFDMLKNIAEDKTHKCYDKANAFLGRVYFKSGDFNNAEKYLSVSAENGNNFAMYNLGKLYLSSEKQNLHKADYWLKKSADLDNQNAQCAYGLLCLKSDNKSQGYYYLSQSANNGNDFAKKILKKKCSVAKKYHTKNLTRPYKTQQAVSKFRVSMSQCVSTINSLLSEYEQHIKQLQREFEYENNIAVSDELEAAYDYSI